MSAGAVQFLGKEPAYWRLRIKGAALLLLTLGLYRFWFATDVRRFLWANTEIAGDTLEYTGLATELLVGFLFAIAILVPLYTIFAIGALELTPRAPVVVIAGLVVVTLLGEFALYRARRYRLTRTVFRGVQFDQHGAAWRYAIYALVWWGSAIVTLGLAYPWAQASLQRFKMKHTCYGDLEGAFVGRAAALFVRGLPMWLAVVGPIVFAFFALGALVDWNTLNTAVAQGDQATLAFIEIKFGLSPRCRHRLSLLGARRRHRRAALSAVSDGQPALVDFRPALRRHRRDDAAQSRADLSRLSALPSLSFPVDARHRGRRKRLSVHRLRAGRLRATIWRSPNCWRRSSPSGFMS